MGAPKVWVLGAKDQPWAEGQTTRPPEASRGLLEKAQGDRRKGQKEVLPNYLTCPALGPLLGPQSSPQLTLANYLEEGVCH